MARALTRWINQHEFPRLYYRIPGMLPFQWFVNRVLYHRTWLIRREIRHQLTKLSHDFTVLDAGCGAGDFIVPYARAHPQGWFSGVDAATGNIRLLEHFCTRKRIPNIRTVSGDLESIDLRGPYDLLICASVLNYIRDRSRFLKKISDTLSANGRLILYLPVHYRRRIPGYENFRTRFLKDVDYEANKGTRMDIEEQKLIQELEDSGLQVISRRGLYGFTGQIAYEITSASILIIKKAPWIFSVVLTLIYFPVVHPILLLLMTADYLLDSTKGNGLLIVAEKTIER